MDWFVGEKIGNKKVVYEETVLQQFYTFLVKETTTINGEVKKKEVRKIFHITYQKPDVNGYTAIVETFDRVEKNRDASVSEKVFTEKLTAIVSTLELQIDPQGRMVQIQNMPLLHEKRAHTMQQLSKKYIGRYAERSIEAWNSLYRNEQRLILYLKKYDELGLLFHPFYRLTSGENTEKNELRYPNFLDHTLVFVKESINNRLQDESDQEKTHLAVGGKIVEPLYFEMLNKSMELQEIPFDATKDKPQLEAYDGNLIFYTQTGRLHSAQLAIHFTYGKHYEKKIDYILKEASYEEI